MKAKALCAALCGVLVVTLTNGVVVPETAQAKGVFGKIKKTAKRTASKVRKAANRTAKGIGKGANSAVHKLGKLGKDSVNAVKKAAKAAAKLAKKLTDAAKRLIVSEAKKLANKVKNNGGKLAAALVKSLESLAKKVVAIAKNLVKGSKNAYKAAVKAMRSLIKQSGLKSAIAEARRLMGATSFTVIANVGGGMSGVQAGQAVGIAINLGKASAKRPACLIFAASGLALSTEALPNIGGGVSLGFFRGDPTKALGAAVDVVAAIGSVTGQISWAFPTVKTTPLSVKFYPNPILYLVGASVGLSASAAAGSISVGGSYGYKIKKITRF